MVNMDPMENRRKRQRNNDNDGNGIGYNYMNSSVQYSTNQGPSGSSPSTSTSPYPYSANNSISERNQTGKRLRTESYFMTSSMNHANHHQAPPTSTSFWANNSFSERNSTTNHQRGLRGNYIRPSILDREKNKPYSRILKIRPRRERNDEIHVPHMTTTAMKIVESLAKNSSPVVQYAPPKGPPIQFSPSLLQDRTKTSPMFQKILGKYSPSTSSSSTFHQNMTRTSPSYQNQNNSSPIQRNVTPGSSNSTQQQEQDRKIHLDLDTHLDDDIKFSEPLALGRLIKMYKTSKESPSALMKPPSSQTQAPAFTFNNSMSKDNENDKSRTSTTFFDNSTSRNFSPLNKINTKASVDSPDNKSTSGNSALFGGIQAPSSQFLPPAKPFTFPKSTNWECPSCMVSNKDHILSCACCEEPKPGSKKEIKDPSPSTQPFTIVKTSDWECSSCMVSNKDHILSCVCCSEPKPGSKKEIRDSTPPLSSQPFSFGLPATAASSTSVNPASASTFSGFGVAVKKGWECSTCMVNNKVEDLSCICCSEPKPGSKNVDKNQNITTSTTPFSFGFGAAAATTTQSSTPPTTPTVAASAENDKKLSFTSTSTTSSLPNNFSFGLPSSTSITKPTIPSYSSFSSTFDSAKNAGSKTSTSLFPTTSTPSVTPSGFSFGLPASASTPASTTTAFNSLSEVKPEPKTTIPFSNTSIIVTTTTSPTQTTTTTFTAPTTASNFSFGLPSSTAGAKRKSTTSSDVYPNKIFTSEKPSDNLGLFGTPTPAFGQEPSQSSLLFSSQPQQAHQPKTTFKSFSLPAAAITQEQKPNNIQTPAFTFGTASVPKENDICKTTTATPSFSFGGPSSANINSIKPTVVASGVPTINSFSFGSTTAENKSIFGGVQGQSHSFGGVQAAPPQNPPPSYQMFNSQAQIQPIETQQNSLFNNSFSVPQIPQQQQPLTNNIQPAPAFNLTPNFNFGVQPAQTQQPGAGAPLFTFSSTPQGDSNGGSIGERKIKQARRRIR